MQIYGYSMKTENGYRTTARPVNSVVTNILNIVGIIEQKWQINAIEIEI